MLLSHHYGPRGPSDKPTDKGYLLYFYFQLVLLPTGEANEAGKVPFIVCPERGWFGQTGGNDIIWLITSKLPESVVELSFLVFLRGLRGSLESCFHP